MSATVTVKVARRNAGKGSKPGKPGKKRFVLRVPKGIRRVPIGSLEDWQECELCEETGKEVCYQRTYVDKDNYHVVCRDCLKSRQEKGQSFHTLCPGLHCWFIGTKEDLKSHRCDCMMPCESGWCGEYDEEFYTVDERLAKYNPDLKLGAQICDVCNTGAEEVADTEEYAEERAVVTPVAAPCDPAIDASANELGAVLGVAPTYMGTEAHDYTTVDGKTITITVTSHRF